MLLMIIAAMQLIILFFMFNNVPEKQLISSVNEQPNIIHQNDYHDTVLVEFGDKQVEYLASLIKKSIKEELVAMETQGFAAHVTQQTQEYFSDHQMHESNNALQIIESELAGLSETSTPENYINIHQLTANLTPSDHMRYIDKARELYMTEQISSSQFSTLIN